MRKAGMKPLGKPNLSWWFLLLASLLAGWGGEPARVQTSPHHGERLSREVASQLLTVELRNEGLRQWVSTSAIRGKDARLAYIEEVGRHVALCVELLKQPEERAIRQAEIGLHLAALSYDFLRTDIEATVRGFAGVVRAECNFGLNLLARGMAAMRESPAWATSDEAHALVLKAVSHRDNVLAAAPIVNVLKTGVMAANTTSAAVSLVALTRASATILQRIVNWMGGARIPMATLELTGGGAGTVQLRAISTAGALVLTDIEVMGLAQVGQLSASAFSLYMMANGRPPKLPNSRAVEEWARRAPRQPPRSTDKNFTIYQVRHCGPEEYLVEAANGQKVWADGVRSSDACLLEAKFIGNAERSPFIASSKIPEALRSRIRAELAEEFSNYAAVIRDPKTPFVRLEVITNDARAVPFLEGLLQEFGIAGKVVVKP